MTPEEVYQIWAPSNSIWSAWAIPVPFAQMVCTENQTLQDVTQAEAVARWFAPSSELTLVVDLAGPESVRLGLALARQGFRPVPVIDGSPGPGLGSAAGTWAGIAPAAAPRGVAVDMRELLVELCRGANMLKETTIAVSASPVFLLDANRLANGRSVSGSEFDNRWKTFPQDFPSARFLQEHGILRATLVQERAGQPQEDLAHVLLRWQEAGIVLGVCGVSEGGALRPLSVNRPSHFRALWQRALAIFGLHRGVPRGFGNWPHGPAPGRTSRRD